MTLTTFYMGKGRIKTPQNTLFGNYLALGCGLRRYLGLRQVLYKEFDTEDPAEKVGIKQP